MKLRDLRYNKGITISELSNSLSLDQKRVKVIERGLELPTNEEIELIKHFFDLTNQQVNAIKKESLGSLDSFDNQIIGEGYITSVNKNFKVYEPQITKLPNKIKLIDIFCGIGGLSYGFEQANQFTTIAGIDLLHDRIKSFQLNHKHAFGFNYDVNQIQPKKLLEYIHHKPDIIVGGAPCQGFSSIRPFRSLTENDKRNNLFRSFAEFLKSFNPSWFVFENVVGLLTHKNGLTLKTLISEFESLNYKVDFKILNAAYYGVPQLRERLIIVGNNLNIKFKWPEPTFFYNYKSMAGTDNPYLLKPKSSSECFSAITVDQALNDLPPIKSGENANIYLQKNKLNDYQKYLREGSSKLTFHDATSHSESMLKIISKSGYNIDSVKHLVTSGFSTSYSRLEPDRPSVTLTVNFVHPSSNKCIHPYQNRALTPREGARIQGFPDKFDFYGNRTQIVKQIGNAVPPILSKVIAESIFKYF